VAFVEGITDTDFPVSVHSFLYRSGETYIPVIGLGKFIPRDSFTKFDKPVKSRVDG